MPPSSLQLSTTRSKSPLLAALLSALLCGLGQIYDGRYLRGIILMALMLLLWAMGGLLGALTFGSGDASLRHCGGRAVDFWRGRRLCRQPPNPSGGLQGLVFSGGGSHNSTRFPSGSIIQAKRPYSSFSSRRSISTPASSNLRHQPVKIVDAVIDHGLLRSRPKMFRVGGKQRPHRFANRLRRVFFPPFKFDAGPGR